MSNPAAPQVGDIVIYRRSATSYTISVSSRTAQISCRTFEEALQRATTFAQHEHVAVWYTTDNKEFKPVEGSGR